jgi:hypothetical protein
MTPDRYALLIAVTGVAILGAVLSGLATGKLRQARLYFARDAKDFNDTLNGFEPQLRASLRWDHLFLIGYGALFGLIGWYQLGQWWGRPTMFFGVVGAILDVLENRALVALAVHADDAGLRRMQTLCVTKFTCSGIAILGAAMFFAGSDFWKRASMLFLILGALGLITGCLLFVFRRAWSKLAGQVVPVGLFFTFVGLILTMIEFVRECLNPSLRPF